MTTVNFEETAGRRIATGLFGLLATVAIATYAKFSRWREMRKAINRLGEAPDAMLRDIGIARGGIENAVRNGRR